MIISLFNLGLGSSDKKDGMCLEMLKLGQSIKDIWSWLTVFIMEGALCPCSRPDFQNRESRGWFLISFTLILLMSLWWIVLFIVGSYFTGYYEFISFFLFRFILLMSLSFFANSFRFEFHSSVHIVTSHHTFLCVNQLWLTKLFAFHAFDQTSWRLKWNVDDLSYFMHLSDICQKIFLFWYQTILYWPWSMFVIWEWQLSELTALNSNVALSLFPILVLVLFFLSLSWIGYTWSSVSPTVCL